MISLNRHTLVRNACIGLVDGLTIPLAVSAGLNAVIASSSTIAIACIVVALAGALTMSFGGYHQSKKYSEGENPVSTAITIGTAYLLGGLLVSLPFFWYKTSLPALKYAGLITILVLFVAGYWESKLNGGNGWMNAVRVCVTAVLAAAAAYLVARLFR
jgi:VIT1/CCC1 family predicted Fe2+/Mn2+ transporter